MSNKIYYFWKKNTTCHCTKYLFIKCKEKIQHFSPYSEPWDEGCYNLCSTQGHKPRSKGRDLTPPSALSSVLAPGVFSEWHRNTNSLHIWQSSMSNSAHIVPSSPRHDHHDPRASLACPETASEAHEVFAPWEYPMWSKRSFFSVCVSRFYNPL